MAEAYQPKAKAQYFGIFEGVFERKVRPENAQAEGAKPRTNKNGNEVWSIQVPALKGMITDVKSETETYKVGDREKTVMKLKIFLDDNVVVDVKWTSGYAIDFMQRFPNVGLGKNVILVPYQFTNDEGTKLSGISIYDGPSDDSQYKVERFFGGADSGKPMLPKWIDLGKDEEGYTRWDKKDFYKALRDKLDETISLSRDKVKNALDAAADYAKSKSEKQGGKVDAPVDDRPLPGMENKNLDDSPFESGQPSDFLNDDDDLPF